MSLLIFLVLFVFPFSLGEIRQDSPKYEKFLQDLEKFAVAAKKQFADQPIPDMNHWRLQRTETIKTLKEMTEKLDKACFYFEWANIVDGTMSIFCKLATLMELIMKYLPSAIYNMTVDSFMCPSAYFTEKGMSIMESILSPIYQVNLQTILMKDRELSHSLNEWFQSSMKLETDVRQIFSFDLKSEKSIQFVLLHELNRLLTTTKNCRESLDLMKRGKYSKFMTDNYRDLASYCIKLKSSPIESEELRNSLSLLSILTSATNTDFVVHRKSKEKKMYETVACFWDKLDTDISSAVKSSAYILLKVLDIARETTSLLNARDISNDVNCLKHVIDILEQELTFMESSFSI